MDVYTGQPIKKSKRIEKLVENLYKVLAMCNCGIKLTFTDIKAIRTIMEEELARGGDST